MEFLWTDYMRYRAESRGFALAKIEDIVRYSVERYFDTETGRQIVIGNHGRELVLIAYETAQTSVTPITIHTTTRQQTQFRVSTGRYTVD